MSMFRDIDFLWTVRWIRADAMAVSRRSSVGGDGHSWQLGVVPGVVPDPRPLDVRVSVRNPRRCRRVQHRPHVRVAARVACDRTRTPRVVHDHCRFELDCPHCARSGVGLRPEAAHDVRAHSTRPDWTIAQRSTAGRRASADVTRDPGPGPAAGAREPRWGHPRTIDELEGLGLGKQSFHARSAVTRKARGRA
jgi:hypothetical protein